MTGDTGRQMGAVTAQINSACFNPWENASFEHCAPFLQFVL
jgi:hypothetical protein